MLGRIGRRWLRRPAMPVIVLGLVVTGVGLLGGNDRLALTGMVIGGLGIALWLAMACGAMELRRPPEGRRPAWRSLAVLLVFLPFIGLCVVAPILLLLAYQQGDRSLLNAAGLIGGVCIVIVVLIGQVGRWLGWMRWPIGILRGVRRLVGPVGGDDPERPMQ